MKNPSKKIKLPYSFLLIVIVLPIRLSHALELDFKSAIQMETIAIEKMTGRPEPNNFAGIVGSLLVNLSDRTIYITEISGRYAEGQKSVELLPTRIILHNLQVTDSYLKFDGFDQYGLPHRGKIWREPGNLPVIGVQIRRKDSPRHIRNLSAVGRKFMQEQKVAHLYLGLGDENSGRASGFVDSILQYLKSLSR